jgi:hypothetical protein
MPTNWTTQPMLTIEEEYCTIFTHTSVSPIVWMPKPSLEGITLRSVIETMARIKLIKVILDLDPKFNKGPQSFYKFYITN